MGLEVGQLVLKRVLFIRYQLGKAYELIKEFKKCLRHEKKSIISSMEKRTLNFKSMHV